jgi:hypothetical protein
MRPAMLPSNIKPNLARGPVTRTVTKLLMTYLLNQSLTTPI